MLEILSDLDLLSRKSIDVSAAARALPPGGWLSDDDASAIARPMLSGFSNQGYQIWIGGDATELTEDVEEIDKLPVLEGSYHAITDQYFTADSHTPVTGEGLFISQDAANVGKVQCDVKIARSGIVLGTVVRTRSNYEYKGVTYPEVIEYIVGLDPVIIGGTGGFGNFGFGTGGWGF